MDISPQPSPLDQPAVITTTSQPAANPTGNQTKLPNRSEQALHNSFSCVAAKTMRCHLFYETIAKVVVLTSCLAEEEDEFDMFAQTRGSSLADQRKR